MLTKTQAKIMETFVSKISDNFSIKQISELLKKPYPLIHREIKKLVNERFIIRDKRKLLSLNYKENSLDLAYIEHLRTKEFVKKIKALQLFINDVFKIEKDFFILLIFGSAIEKNNPRDIDILFIIEDKKKINETEKVLENIASNLSLNFDISVISVESVYEMLSKRDSPNIMNETLNKHIIVFGAENFYKILKNARQ